MQELWEQRRPPSHAMGKKTTKGFWRRQRSVLFVCLLFLQQIFTEHLLADVVPGAGGAAMSCSLSSWSSIALKEIEHQVLNFRWC